MFSLGVMNSPRLPSIHAWRYAENRRNYPGVHLTADKDGCAQLQQAIAVSVDESANRPYVTVQLSPPTSAVLSVPNNRSNTALAFQKLRLQVVLEAEPNLLEVSISEFVCGLKYSKDMAARLIAAVQEVSRDHGDFSIGSKDPDVVWFWWYLMAPKPASERGE